LGCGALCREFEFVYGRLAGDRRNIFRIKHTEEFRHLCLTIQTRKKEKTDRELRTLKFRRFQKKLSAQWPAPRWAA
jgi:hypothetical protein